MELPKGLWGWLPAIITSPSEDIVSFFVVHTERDCAYICALFLEIYKNGLDA